MTPPSASSPSAAVLTRRSFLTTTGAATAFTLLDAVRARGADVAPRVKAGVVGLGGRGGWIADHVAQHPGFEVTAVADYFATVAHAAGERLKVAEARRFSGLLGYRRLLDAGVEAVFLETPPYFFPEHAAAAVAAGCHVYVAKPVAVDVPGCLRILDAGRKAAAGGKVFLVDFQTRTDPYHREAIRQVHAGALGRLGLLGSFYHDECFADPPREKTVANLLRSLAWVNDTALGGGYIVNCDIHALDVALWLAGDLPQRAVGLSARRRPNAVGDSHDCYAVSFEFEDGLVLSHRSEHLRNGTDFQSGCHAYGETGHLEASYAGKVFFRSLEDGYAGGENKNLYADGMKANVDAFHRAIVAGDVSNPTLVPSVNSTLAALLGREAAGRGRSLTWDELLKDTRRLEVDLAGLTA